MRPADPPILLRWTLVFLFFVCFCFAARFVAWLIVPCFLAFIVYYLISPFTASLEGRGLTLSQSVWVIFGVLGLFTYFCLPTLLGPLFVSKATLIADAEKYLRGARSLVLDLVDLFQRHTGFMDDTRLRSTIDLKMTHFIKEELPEQLPTLAINLLSFVPLLLLVPFTTFFLLRDGRDFKKAIVRGIPNAFFERALFLFDRVDRQVTGFLRGVFIEAAVVGALIGTGFYVIEFTATGDPKNYVLVGVAAALFNLIPYLGPILVCAMAAVLAFTDTQSSTAALTVALLFVITKLIDDFVIAPMVLGKSMKLHPVAVVFALIIGGEIAGFVGLMLALPVLGVTLVVFDVLYLTFRDQRLRLRHRQTRRSLLDSFNAA